MRRHLGRVERGVGWRRAARVCKKAKLHELRVEKNRNSLYYRRGVAANGIKRIAAQRCGRRLERRNKDRIGRRLLRARAVGRGEGKRRSALWEHAEWRWAVGHLVGIRQHSASLRGKILRPAAAGPDRTAIGRQLRLLGVESA